MKTEQFRQIKELLIRVEKSSPFYQEKFKGIQAADIKSPEDFTKLPFTTKADLRDAYPLGLMAVEESRIVRIHSSSGTTGQPVIIPYTKEDVQDWAKLFARCYQMAGITNRDRVQITPGYGLWTAGIGFQAGCELLGAMAVPMGPGNTEKQLKMMVDMQTTVLASTASYALLLAEQVMERGLQDKIALKRGIIGSERWGDKMRERISQALGIELFDIYGLTEIYGPGISIDCHCHNGLHYWDDYVYFEIVDPHTGNPIPEGEYGELVITTLRKQGAPLIRFRTHDISRFIPGTCLCGSPFPRHSRIIGRTDDMIKVKGVNMFPAYIDTLLHEIPGVSSEYTIVLDHEHGVDRFLLRFEVENGYNCEEVADAVGREFKAKIGIKIVTQAEPLGTLPRVEGKSKRVVDYRTR